MRAMWFCFLLVGPGYALVRRTEVVGALRWVLVVATSCALTAVCSEVLAIAGRWNSTRLLGILALLTGIAVLWPGRRRGRHR